MERIVLDFVSEEGESSCTENPAIKFIEVIQKYSGKQSVEILVRVKERELPPDVVSMIAERNGFVLKTSKRLDETTIEMLVVPK